MGKPLTEKEYPILSILFQSGINGFYKFAADQHGFRPSDHYLSKCHLCYDIRRYLVRERRIGSEELQPETYYDQE